MQEIAEGLWRWTARHPSWHPPGFGEVVGSYALRHPRGTLLVDPQLPDPPDGALAALDGIVRGPVDVVVTIPYHVRSTPLLAERYDAAVHAHPGALTRPGVDPARFRPLTPGVPLPGGAVAIGMGAPPRPETPVHLPSHRALVVGDALVTVDGALRVWFQARPRAGTLAWYRTRFRTGMAQVLALDVDRVLTTHGEPVLRDGAAALRAALDAPPWYLEG